METSIAEPLSGDEVVEAVLDLIGQKLRRDCFLSRNSAYESFEGKITVHLRLKDVGRIAEVQTEVPFVLRKAGNDATEIDEEMFLDEQLPNVTRVNTGQAVPVLVQSGEGRPEVKTVKYGRPKTAPVVDDGEPLI